MIEPQVRLTMAPVMAPSFPGRSRLLFVQHSKT